jgi:hypothetical protein
MVGSSLAHSFKLSLQIGGGAVLLRPIPRYVRPGVPHRRERRLGNEPTLSHWPNGKSIPAGSGQGSSQMGGAEITGSSSPQRHASVHILA